MVTRVVPLVVFVAGVCHGCPDRVSVATTFDGVDLEFEFDRSESLLGQGLAYALCHRLHSIRSDNRPCSGICSAQVLADIALQLFTHEGCGGGDSGGPFDVIQVGAHVGNSTDSRGRLIDPIFEWLLEAPPSSSALLVEPIRSSFEALVATRAAHG